MRKSRTKIGVLSSTNQMHICMIHLICTKRSKRSLKSAEQVDMSMDLLSQCWHLSHMLSFDILINYSWLDVCVHGMVVSRSARSMEHDWIYPALVHSCKKGWFYSPFSQFQESQSLKPKNLTLNSTNNKNENNEDYRCYSLWLVCLGHGIRAPN